MKYKYFHLYLVSFFGLLLLTGSDVYQSDEPAINRNRRDIYIVFAVDNSITMNGGRYDPDNERWDAVADAIETLSYFYLNFISPLNENGDPDYDIRIHFMVLPYGGTSSNSEARAPVSFKQSSSEHAPVIELNKIPTQQLNDYIMDWCNTLAAENDITPSHDHVDPALTVESIAELIPGDTNTANSVAVFYIAQPYPCTPSYCGSSNSFTNGHSREVKTFINELDKGWEEFAIIIGHNLDDRSLRNSWNDFTRISRPTGRIGYLDTGIYQPVGPVLFTQLQLMLYEFMHEELKDLPDVYVQRVTTSDSDLAYTVNYQFAEEVMLTYPYGSRSGDGLTVNRHKASDRDRPYRLIDDPLANYLEVWSIEFPEERVFALSRLGDHTGLSNEFNSYVFIWEKAIQRQPQILREAISEFQYMPFSIMIPAVYPSRYANIQVQLEINCEEPNISRANCYDTETFSLSEMRAGALSANERYLTYEHIWMLRDIMHPDVAHDRYYAKVDFNLIVDGQTIDFGRLFINVHRLTIVLDCSSGSEIRPGDEFTTSIEVLSRFNDHDPNSFSLHLESATWKLEWEKGVAPLQQLAIGKDNMEKPASSPADISYHRRYTARLPVAENTNQYKLTLNRVDFTSAGSLSGVDLIHSRVCIRPIIAIQPISISRSNQLNNCVTEISVHHTHIPDAWLNARTIVMEWRVIDVPVLHGEVPPVRQGEFYTFKLSDEYISDINMHLSRNNPERMIHEYQYRLVRRIVGRDSFIIYPTSELDSVDGWGSCKLNY